MAGRGTDIVLGGNAEFMAKAEMEKLGFTEELIVQATGFAETDDEEILNARKPSASSMPSIRSRLSRSRKRF